MKLKTLMEGQYDAKDTDLEAKGLLTYIQAIAQDIRSTYESAESILKPAAIRAKNRSDLEFEKVKYSNSNRVGLNSRDRDRDRIDNERRGGGWYQHGGDRTFKDHIEYIKRKLNEVVLKEIVKDLDTIYLRQNNPVMSAAVNEPSLISMLYNDYQDRRNRVGPFVAAQELSQQLHNNSLVPREVLAVSTLDKTVFVFVTLFIRLFALSIAELLIERGWLKTMAASLATFIGLYTVIFVLFVLLVNLDVYRMRILFNYVNFHANSGLVYSHIGMLLMFAVIIYIIMRNVNFPIKGFEITAVSEEDKSHLIYRLEILTMLVWLFLVILVVVM
jgi:hypothetical protein